ncbi:Ig-like domain-containing protein [Flagellimonas allohymeniacidonis]|uniref:Uncharacterized protein n=1 Tax=Flagellimonas allohymeniacidonis TaxID=2517819 RepID=A0A4Q8QLS8_9FLAO|nr:Ig-like domain-containing protein [Allomuricauda hymeniacidonis]TAI49236.1 hypothetical protein EW142_05410 [Allomuricauda hymeniacidonis]
MPNRFLPRPISLLIFAVIQLLIFQGCSGEDNEETSPETVVEEPEKEEVIGQLSEEDIVLDIEAESVLKNSTIEITLPENANVDSVKAYINEDLLTTLTSPPFVVPFEPMSYEDGDYQLKIEVTQEGGTVTSKIIEVKIDNTGPVLLIQNLEEDQKVCDELVVSPQITDEISEISKVEVFLDDTIIEVFENTSDFDFTINKDGQELGNQFLKFVMQDSAGNVSRDSLNILLSKKVVSLNFPDNFIRMGVDKVHAILSDENGEFLDVVTHSSGVSETLSLCTTEIISEDQELMLTFVEDFQNTILNFYVYGNLSKNVLGGQISFTQRSAGLQTASVDLELPDYEDGFYLRFSTAWSSGIYFNNTLSGFVSKTFTNNELGFDKTFVMNFNRNLGRSYQWAFVENIDEKTSLLSTDFSSTDVIHDFLTVNGTFSSPFLSIYGFESEAHYRSMSGHMIYWNAALSSINGNDYSYADIFDYTLYSIKVDNYGVDGTGRPPESISVPSGNVYFNFSDNRIEFNGTPGYEVGRVRLQNFENENIIVEFIFDGQESGVVVPKLPQGLFSQSVNDTFEMQRLEPVQGAAENYENISDYESYISEILVPSVPFYLVAPKRERIFAQSGLLPIFEFPFHERL